MKFITYNKMYSLLTVHIIFIVLMNQIIGNFAKVAEDEKFTINLSHLGQSVYGSPEPKVGKKLEKWNPKMGNPEEQGSYIEGDILIPSAVPRNGIVDKAFRWKDGVIPYEIIGDFSPEQKKEFIEQAFEIYHNNTCIKFVKRTDENDYISISSNATGCWSSVGRIGGKQDINLQNPQCLWKVGTIIHELMHAIGFFHEQSRYERDNFVSINWRNIEMGQCGNFAKKNRDDTTAYNTSYDFESIMHYSSDAFSANGEPTLIPYPPISETEAVKIGQRNNLSKNDIIKIQRMYECEK